MTRAMNQASNPETDRPPRGVIYFCEQSHRYRKGMRAWLFFGPYLLGAILLEPALTAPGRASCSAWLLLLAYLLLFPRVWRGVLLRTGLWRRRNEQR